MQKYRILVVGAGIAGAAAAAFLGRRGHDVTLVERSARVRSSGSPVDVRGSGLDAIRALGAEGSIREHDTGARTLALVDRDGRRFTTMRLRSASDDIEIARVDLANVLTAIAQDAADVRFDTTFTALMPDAAGVDVVLSDRRAERFDLVVAADGQHSATRSLMWDGPGAPTSSATSMNLVVATIPLERDPDDVAVVEMHNEPGASLTVHPAGGRQVGAFIFRTRDVPRTASGQRDLLRTRYAATGWRAAEAIAALDRDGAADALYFDDVRRVSAQRWSHGRVVLAGDAASSLTILGNGSSTALMGAQALDSAVAEEKALPVALARYEREVRAAAVKAQRGAAAGASFLVPASRAGLGFRNLVARMTRSV
jgi:2-polyprenyl-6-methoxyphenol hydroxylase-like FAD-dependent oxidoreductase